MVVAIARRSGFRNGADPLLGGASREARRLGLRGKIGRSSQNCRCKLLYRKDASFYFFVFVPKTPSCHGTGSLRLPITGSARGSLSSAPGLPEQRTGPQSPAVRRRRGVCEKAKCQRAWSRVLGRDPKSTLDSHNPEKYLFQFLFEKLRVVSEERL